MRSSAGVVAAIVVAGIAFLSYHATMLPGLELGDSASFQVRAGSPTITPRDGYPLYFAVGSLFVRATGDDPARAMNLASAVFGAASGGLIAIVAAELAGSVIAGAAAALLFAGSYTFWSQAVIAEVYTLHVLLVTLTLLLLLRWSCKPTTGRLAWFFAVYAVSFGNHLSMILLAPAYAAFLLSGGRNADTPFETASTPVIAVQPLENAVRIVNRPSAPSPPVPSGSGIAGAGSGSRVPLM
jgi:uncharacterized membrane protein